MASGMGWSRDDGRLVGWGRSPAARGRVDRFSCASWLSACPRPSTRIGTGVVYSTACFPLPPPYRGRAEWNSRLYAPTCDCLTALRPSSGTRSPAASPLPPSAHSGHSHSPSGMDRGPSPRQRMWYAAGQPSQHSREPPSVHSAQCSMLPSSSSVFALMALCRLARSSSVRIGCWPPTPCRPATKQPTASRRSISPRTDLTSSISVVSRIAMAAFTATGSWQYSAVWAPLGRRGKCALSSANLTSSGRSSRSSSAGISGSGGRAGGGGGASLVPSWCFASVSPMYRSHSQA
mmetsp:Transcript_20961/g.63104  ORF Transcript_20961/g.63104 Transcript_20961/m.63104 type:complete len:291 (-) Transcript_20961:272-1144(-)